MVISTPAVWAGPVAEQFGSGYDGVSWGLSLAQLVGMIPEGDHYFSTSLGHRVYTVKNDEPFLGVPRAGTRIQYHLGIGGVVESIAVGIPYERREQLFGALIPQFGRPTRVDEVGNSLIYTWPQDRDVRIRVRASKDPRYGILEFWIQHIIAPSQKSHAGGS